MSKDKLAQLGLVALLPLLVFVPTKVKAEVNLVEEYVYVAEESPVLEPNLELAETLYKNWTVEQAKPKKGLQRQSKRFTDKGFTRFASGYCTDYVARRIAIPWSGNARDWMANSKAYGAKVDRIPAVGAIIQTNESRWGHVGYIEKVEGSLVTFSEWNYAGLYVKTTRTLDITDSRIKGIIHVQ